MISVIFLTFVFLLIAVLVQAGVSAGDKQGATQPVKGVAFQRVIGSHFFVRPPRVTDRVTVDVQFRAKFW
jgi:hypothetical protein